MSLVLDTPTGHSIVVVGLGCLDCAKQLRQLHGRVRNKKIGVFLIVNRMFRLVYDGENERPFLRTVK